MAESVWPGTAGGRDESDRGGAPVDRRRSRNRGSERRGQADDNGGARADRESDESSSDGSVQAFDAGGGDGSGGDLPFTGLGLGALLGAGLVLALGGLMLRRRAARSSAG